MKTLSLITMATLLSLAACSHHKKSCCGDKKMDETCKTSCDKKEKSKCEGDSCKKPEAKVETTPAAQKTPAPKKKK